MDSSRGSRRFPFWLGCGPAFLALAILACVPFPSPAQPGTTVTCRFPQRPSQPLGYRQRGTRCEGIYREDPQFQYEQPVPPSASIALISLTRTIAPYDASAVDSLILRWSAPSPARVSITGGALRRGLHYGMDTRVGPAGSSFAWHGELLRALRIGPSELAALASVPYTFSGFADTLRLPVDVGTAERAGQSSAGYDVVLLLREEPRAVYFTLSSLSGPQQVGRPIMDHRAAALRPVPTANMVRFTVPFPPSQGIYYLEIEARLWDGRRVSTGYLISHDPS